MPTSDTREGTMSKSSWTIGELRAALTQFEGDLKAARFAPNTVQTYIDRAERFLRYLTGDYVPDPSNAKT
jgi:hypothetical protein